MNVMASTLEIEEVRGEAKDLHFPQTPGDQGTLSL